MTTEPMPNRDDTPSRLNNTDPAGWAKLNQQDQVLKYLGRFGSITSLEAIRDLGITRLADVVLKLRKAGHRIDTTEATGKNRWNAKTKFGRYRVERAGQTEMGVTHGRANS